MPTIQSSGAHLIQMLNIIVLHDVDALAGAPDWPGDNFVYDPSSGGSSTLWGTSTIGTDPSTGLPVSGTTLRTRSPGGPDGTPAKRRKGGNGLQPGPNTLSRAEAFPGPHKCFVGQIRAQITKPFPDVYGYNGTSALVFGVLCAPYVPPTIPGPVTAMVMRTITDPPFAGLAVGAVPVGSLVEDAVARFLTLNVGSDSFATVTGDQYAGPGADCTVGGATCGGSITPDSPTGTSLGAVIRPA